MKYKRFRNLSIVLLAIVLLMFSIVTFGIFGQNFVSVSAASSVPIVSEEVYEMIPSDQLGDATVDTITYDGKTFYVLNGVDLEDIVPEKDGYFLCEQNGLGHWRTIAYINNDAYYIVEPVFHSFSCDTCSDDQHIHSYSNGACTVCHALCPECAGESDSFDIGKNCSTCGLAGTRCTADHSAHCPGWTCECGENGTGEHSYSYGTCSDCGEACPECNNDSSNLCIDDTCSCGLEGTEDPGNHCPGWTCGYCGNNGTGDHSYSDGSCDECGEDCPTCNNYSDGIDIGDTCETCGLEGTRCTADHSEHCPGWTCECGESGTGDHSYSYGSCDECGEDCPDCWNDSSNLCTDDTCYCGLEGTEDRGNHCPGWTCGFCGNSGTGEHSYSWGTCDECCEDCPTCNNDSDGIDIGDSCGTCGLEGTRCTADHSVHCIGWMCECGEYGTGDHYYSYGSCDDCGEACPDCDDNSNNLCTDDTCSCGLEGTEDRGDHCPGWTCGYCGNSGTGEHNYSWGSCDECGETCPTCNDNSDDIDIGDSCETCGLEGTHCTVDHSEHCPGWTCDDCGNCGTGEHHYSYGTCSECDGECPDCYNDSSNLCTGDSCSCGLEGTEDPADHCPGWTCGYCGNSGTGDHSYSNGSCVECGEDCPTCNGDSNSIAIGKTCETCGLNGPACTVDHNQHCTGWVCSACSKNGTQEHFWNYTTTCSDCGATHEHNYICTCCSQIKIFGSVSISGTTKVGSTLTATYSGGNSSSVGSNITYQWYRDDTLIDGATASTYNLVSSDKEHTIKAAVVGTGSYTGSIVSEPTLTISSDDITVTSTNGTATYSGSATNGGASVTVSVPVTGYTIKYGTTSGTYDLDTIPTFTDANVYTVYYKVTATGYSDFTGSLIITINKAAAVITVDTTKITKTYDGSEPSLPTAVTNFGSLTVTKSDEFFINVGTYTVTYEVAGTDNYTGDTKTLEIEITKATYDMSAVQFENASYVYDGAEKTITITGTLPAGVTVAYATNTLTNAGSVTATATFTGSDNYNAIDDMSAVLTITKAAAVITVDTTKITKTYDGTEPSIPTAAINFGSLTVTKSEESFINVGTYTVTYTVEGTDNYDGAIKTLEVEIIKATYDMSNAKWNYASAFTYDGKEKKTEVSGLPEGVTASYTDNVKTNAGTYTAKVTFTIADTDNYNVPSMDDLSWTISKGAAVITVDTTTITVTEGTGVTLPSATSTFGEVTCDKTASDFTEAGTYTVTYAVEGTENYSGDTKTLTVVVKATKVTEPDDDGDVTIDTPEGIDPDAVIKVTVEVKVEAEITDTKPYQNDSVSLAKNEYVSAVYDVKLYVNGVEVQPSDLGEGTKLTIEMILPESVDVSKLTRILHVHSDSDIESIAFSSENYDAETRTYTLDDVTKLSSFVFVYERSGISGGAVAGITAGSILWLLLLIYVLGYFFLYRRGHLDDSAIRVIYKWLPRGNKNKTEYNNSER